MSRAARDWPLIAVCFLAGCSPTGGDALVIATAWPAADRERLESEFARWQAAPGRSEKRPPIRIAWRRLAPGDPLERVVSRRDRPDVLLGGAAISYERLARAQRLAPLPLAGSPPWSVSRRGVIRVVPDPPARSGEGLRGEPAGIAFDDPRGDPVSLAWAGWLLDRDGFAPGYARLVRAAGIRRRIGRSSGEAAAGRRGADAAPAVEVDQGGHDDPGAAAWEEGVAIVADGTKVKPAETFITFLKETQHIESPAEMDRSHPLVRDLLAELLGATLVDSQDELRDAWTVLERAGHPPDATHWMTEPPPWPPASIARALDRDGDQGMAKIEMLAAQLAADPASRAWLLRAWLSPARSIDRAALEELARAADGRLAADPRFREWLRAEWTAWARQRYRRVLRNVAGRNG